MSTVIDEVAVNVPSNLSKPVSILSKLPTQILNKFIFGVKFGVGGTAFVIGAALVVILIASVLAMGGFSLSSITKRGQSALGL